MIKREIKSSGANLKLGLDKLSKQIRYWEQGFSLSEKEITNKQERKSRKKEFIRIKGISRSLCLLIISK